MKHNDFRINRTRRRFVPGVENRSYGTARSVGQRIRESRLFQIDPEIIVTPCAYDNDDVPLFQADPSCNYRVQSRRNLVGVVPDWATLSDPTPDPTPDSIPDPGPGPTTPE